MVNALRQLSAVATPRPEQKDVQVSITDRRRWFAFYAIIAQVQQDCILNYS